MTYNEELLKGAYRLLMASFIVFTIGIATNVTPLLGASALPFMGSVLLYVSGGGLS